MTTLVSTTARGVYSSSGMTIPFGKDVFQLSLKPGLFFCRKGARFYQGGFDIGGYIIPTQLA